MICVNITITDFIQRPQSCGHTLRSICDQGPRSESYKDGNRIIPPLHHARLLAASMAYENFCRKELGDILTDFLHAIKFEVPQLDYDFSLEKPVMDHFRTQPWPAAYTDKAVKMAKWASTGVGYCYPFADKNTRVAYSIHSVYLFLVDDSAEDLGTALDHFTKNLVLGKPQESPILQSLVNWLGDSDNPINQGSFTADMNIKSTIDHVRGCMLERDYDGKLNPPRGATNFPGYLRAKTGFAETYALFCFPENLYPESTYLQVYLPAIQDLCEYINYANDILSFYKESVVGPERLTYIPTFARTHGLDLNDSLRKVTENVAEHVQNIRVILAEYPQLLKTTEEFFQGYISWYLDQTRYRLGDLAIRVPDGKPYPLGNGFGRKVSVR